jgi:hypothetical protein
MKQKLHFAGNKCVLFLLLLTLTQTSYSQLGPIDAGFTLAPSNFLGDLGGNYGKGTGFLKDNNFSMTRVFVGVHLTANPSEYFSFRLAANYGNISGDDAVINGKGGLEEARIVRNLNFKSRITEALFLAEVYPLVILEEDPYDTWHKIRPYGVIGAGYFHFNPQGQDPATGGWVYLKPLHTEGQGFPEFPERKEYKLSGFNIPMGFGAKYFASDNMTLSMEIIHRKTFTDYIDDVSTVYIDRNLFFAHMPVNQAIIAQRMYDKSGSALNRNTGKKRGTATNKDGYYSIGLKASFRLGTGDRSFRNSTRCPVMRY